MDWYIIKPSSHSARGWPPNSAESASIRAPFLAGEGRPHSAHACSNSRCSAWRLLNQNCPSRLCKARDQRLRFG
jgi:hypothetical protein